MQLSISVFVYLLVHLFTCALLFFTFCAIYVCIDVDTHTCIYVCMYAHTPKLRHTSAPVVLYNLSPPICMEPAAGTAGG